jgi:predicted RND superfamily exporter protein
MGVNILLAFVIEMILLVVGIIYGVSGIRRFKESRETSTLVQSIVGIALNALFIALLIAISIPGYLKALAAA